MLTLYGFCGTPLALSTYYFKRFQVVIIFKIHANVAL